MAHTSGANVYWWKAVEASLLSLGIVKDLLISHQKENQLPLNVVAILQSSLDQHNRMAGWLVFLSAFKSLDFYCMFILLLDYTFI